ncbi:hypothetical protein JQ557_34915 [Bradyrhizobium sp. U87765 SZCCT0131]|nr:hypothetical protein [Bradyrhizobium sp. U87765 SZCCT0131]MBR1265795.1 hypothetical protein [Bradyrhizobium sp. U87765 SZCCT0134]MBR1309234.1 hypothetical protein [Bradyrhizobium sp. U87765 SZCCT0110]MBR1323187.1 hypothetical protein [Bradyrhizobium sp. U87765 SZCCT0109]MBR1352460.1 hypothetical protein [Bradyrhizobium sp. U87765 SZCCT0048]
MLYVDIPTATDLAALSSRRDDIGVSIYLPTTPVTREGGADRIALKNLAREALRQLQAVDADKRRVAALAEHLDDLVDDDGFWRHQAHSLAVLATPDNVRTFRLPNALESMVEVSDRFFLKPLLRSVTFANSGHVLALSEGAVRLIEISANLPATAVKVEGLPRDAASAVGQSTINDRSPSGRLQGAEGQKVRLRQFARQVDAALHARLAGSDLPLVLAALPPIAAIYRSVNSYPHLAAAGIDTSPDALSDADLAARARSVLDGLYRDEVTAFGRLFAQRENQGRATTDVAQAARAATFGAVEALMVDIDQVIPGTVADSDGAVTFASAPGARSYGVVDEIAARALRSGARVLAVRQPDIPGGKALAAVLRYPV